MADVTNEWARKLYVCVDNCVDREPVGRIYSPIAGRSGFGGMLPLLQKMESVFDSMNYPQSTHEMRTFDPPPKRVRKMAAQAENHEESRDEMAGKPKAEKIPEDKTIQMQDENGKQATFVISVKYRQNSTWQGKIQWIEEKKERSFRSTLEMIKLMDDALSSKQNEENFDGWEEV